MIGKIKKGKSFGGCIRYVMGKDNAEIIDSDGVLLGNIREITASFNYQRELNPKIKQPVGHIALSFKPEDKALLTDEFMAKIAREYMELMGIKNTQFILVRHHNTDNPHCHLVYNRIGYDGKVISSQSDYKRNEIATKLLKDKYGLTYAEGKGKTNVEKLHASERVKYEIFNAVKAALKHSKTWKEFNDYLLRRGIRLEFVKRTMEIKKPEDIQGIRFTKDGQTFKASQISREFSFARLNAQLSWKPSESQQESERKVQQRIPDGSHLFESTGPGLFNGNRTQSGSLFAGHTDYIFSSMGEELGFVGCLAIMIMEMAIIARCIYVGIHCQDYMRRLVCYGAASALMFQVMINTGMCIGVMPVIGLTLPLISYGGSSVVTIYAMLGLVSGAHARPQSLSHERYVQPYR